MKPVTIPPGDLMREQQRQREAAYVGMTEAQRRECEKKVKPILDQLRQRRRR